MILIGLAALIPAGIITVVALSKKTSPAVKRVAIAALILIALALIVCSLVLLLMFASSAEKGAAGDFPVEPLPEAKLDITAILLAAVVVIFLVTLTIIALRREQGGKNRRK